MKDVFFTIITVWVLWRIMDSFRVNKVQQDHFNPGNQDEGKVNIDSAPSSKNHKKDDDEGEYVDYEEIK